MPVLDGRGVSGVWSMGRDDSANTAITEHGRGSTDPIWGQRALTGSAEVPRDHTNRQMRMGDVEKRHGCV